MDINKTPDDSKRKAEAEELQRKNQVLQHGRRIEMLDFIDDASHDEIVDAIIAGEMPYTKYTG
jgi:hypothetical protein